MKEIKRYEVDADPQDGPASLWDVEDENGKYVYYEDHAAIVAALQEQVRELAAESANLKSACGGDGIYVDCPGCSHSQYAESPDTPATDAALREIRAQVLDDMADDCEADWLDTYIDELRSSAARIRAGEQP